MIKGDEKNCGKWKIEIIENIFMDKENQIKSIRIRTGTSVIERPIQLLYPMELHCYSKSTTSNTKQDKTLNADEFGPKWSTAVAAEQKIRDTASVRDIWFTSSNGGRTIWKSQGYVQFDELCLGLESIQCNITCL